MVTEKIKWAEKITNSAVPILNYDYLILGLYILYNLKSFIIECDLISLEISTFP